MGKKNQKNIGFGYLLRKSLRENTMMYLFLLIPVLYIIIFRYLPMAGNIIAFSKYKTGGSIFGEQWRGFYYFKLFLTDPDFWDKFFNTLSLSIWTLVFAFPLPIIFAILLNEVMNSKFKKFVQTVTIVPKFLSTIVVVMILNAMLSPSSGFINQIIEFFGGSSIYFLNEPEWFIPAYVISELWQFLGWNSIIYMAVLSSADKSLYEAAEVDGAGRFKQTIHITLPVLLPTMSINLIIAVSCALNIGFEKVLLIYKPATYSTADILSTYIYRIGLINSSYSLATAMGLFQGIIGLVFLWGTNKITNKLWGCGLW